MEDEKKVDSYMRIAANHHLHCLYKIGVYGNETQHELYVVGSFINYHKFLKELKQPKLTSKA